MQKDNTSAVIKEYRKLCDSYKIFTEKMKNLVNELLKENNIHVHSVTSRVKTEASLQIKLEKLERKISKLYDVPDISGIRITTYFADEVDSIAEIIENEFIVDEKRSVDKRELLDPDRFGYLSLHYVVKLTKPRLKLTEYKRFRSCCAEIQLRSILQHAWAEIEHDLGYKSKYSVPSEIRRRFSRLAGLLEIADAEFIQIREELYDYEASVPERIAEAPASVSIDKASLTSFIKTSSIVHKLDKKIALLAKSRIIEWEHIIEIYTYSLAYTGIMTIADLDFSLTEEEDKLLKFAQLWIKGTSQESPVGICIIYLCYVLVGKVKSIAIAKSYFDSVPKVFFPDTQEMAEKLISVYSKIADR